jgi:hypothetical protein
MFRAPISLTAGLASGRPGRWSEEIEAVKIGSGARKAPTLWVFVSTMAPAFNTAGLAFAWMGPLQDLVSQSSTMPGPTQESPSRLARPALPWSTYRAKVPLDFSPPARLGLPSGGNVENALRRKGKFRASRARSRPRRATSQLAVAEFFRSRERGFAPLAKSG